jgi:hypothetical protein
VTVTPLLLVHGGSFAGSCWDLVIPHVDGSVSAVGRCDVIDLDAGHMCMISRPAELAGILNDIAAKP